MSKRKKKNTDPRPRRKRMFSEQRLQSVQATGWLKQYAGKNIVHGYKRWFGVDLICAINELRMLGVAIAPEYEAQVRKTVSELIKTSAARKAAAKEPVWNDDSDETFAYIAGYTPAGFPYGVTWEEMNGTSESSAWLDGDEDYNDKDNLKNNELKM